MEKRENRGGFRIGAGRKKSGDEARDKTVCFVCTESEKKLIAETAKALGVSQSEYICSRLFR